VKNWARKELAGNTMEKCGQVIAGITPSDQTDKPSVKVLGGRAYSKDELDKLEKRAGKRERLKTMGMHS
jgi:hypothetical protein